MNKRLLEIYALSVCFVSMGCLSIFSGILLYSIVEISFPTVMNSSPLPYPPPIFNQSGIGTVPIFPGQSLESFSTNGTKTHSAEEKKMLQEEQKRFKKLEFKRMKTESTKSIVRSLIIVFIASLVFRFHWLIAKKARSA